MNTILNVAVRYRFQYGWSVIPIKAGLKLPAVMWKEFTQRKATLDELKKWFTQSNYSLGIVTGSISNLTVLDVDTLQTPRTLKEITSYITALTVRGRHLYFKYCPMLNTTTKIGGEDADIRSEGGFVVAPPSRGYRWLHRNFSLSQLNDFPLDRLSTSQTTQANTFISNAKGWMKDALVNLRPGNRDDTFVKIIGRLHADRHTPDDIFEILTPHAERVLFPLHSLKEKVQYVTTKYENKQRESRSESSIEIYSPRDNWEEYEKRTASKSSPEGKLSTGFPHLDSLLFGFRRGELYTIGARTGIGKTTLCINFAGKLLAQSKRVLFLSTEMSFDTIWDRARNIVGDELLKRSHFYTSDISSPTRRQIEEMIEKVSPDVVILDHIQHMGDSISGRYQELSKLIKSFKDIARAKQIVMICASQLNRQADFQKDPNVPSRPKLSHLKECGSIEEESTVVLLLHRDHPIDDDNDFYVMTVAKNRYGQCGEVNIQFSKKNTRMVEI